MTLFGVFLGNFHILALKTYRLGSIIAALMKKIREQCSRARALSHVCDIDVLDIDILDIGILDIDILDLIYWTTNTM